MWKDTGAVGTTNPARLGLGSRLRLGAISQFLLFGRRHPSHLYQPCISLEVSSLSVTLIYL